MAASCNRRQDRLCIMFASLTCANTLELSPGPAPNLISAALVPQPTNPTSMISHYSGNCSMHPIPHSIAPPTPHPTTYTHPAASHARVVERNASDRHES